MELFCILKRLLKYKCRILYKCISIIDDMFGKRLQCRVEMRLEILSPEIAAISLSKMD